MKPEAGRPRRPPGAKERACPCSLFCELHLRYVDCKQPICAAHKVDQKLSTAGWTQARHAPVPMQHVFLHPACAAASNSPCFYAAGRDRGQAGGVGRCGLGRHGRQDRHPQPRAMHGALVQVPGALFRKAVSERLWQPCYSASQAAARARQPMCLAPQPWTEGVHGEASGTLPGRPSALQS